MRNWLALFSAATLAACAGEISRETYDAPDVYALASDPNDPCRATLSEADGWTRESTYHATTLHYKESCRFVVSHNVSYNWEPAAYADSLYEVMEQSGYARIGRGPLLDGRAELLIWREMKHATTTFEGAYVVSLETDPEGRFAVFAGKWPYEDADNNIRFVNLLRDAFDGFVMPPAE